MKVLFISGYTAATVNRDFTPPRGEELLAKPFSLFSLASKVREVLDGRTLKSQEIIGVD